MNHYANKPLHSDSLQTYLNEISTVDLLTREEEQVLAQRIRAGDDDSFEKLVQANLRFVVSIAKQSKYQGRGLSLIELICEGNFGLMKAARHYDETKGPRFIGYAVWWIRQSIRCALGERLIRLPIRKVDELREIDRRIKAHERRLGSCDADVEDPITRPVWSHLPISLDAHQYSDYDLTRQLHDPNALLPDQEHIEKALKEEIVRTISTLTPREQIVISMYFGINTDRSYTLEEIGEHLGFTRECIRKVKLKAIQRLRHAKGSRLATFSE